MSWKKLLVVQILFTSLAMSLFADVNLKNAVIVHPDRMVNWEKDAVKDLQTALEKITGKKILVRPERSAPKKGVRIFVGNTRSAASAGVNVKKMEPQEFRIKTAKGDLYIAGGTPTGTSYGVSWFLQKNFGVYQIDFDCFSFPKNADPKIKEMNYTKKPDIMDRDIYNLMLSSRLTPANKRSWHQFYRRNFLEWHRPDRNTPGYRISRMTRACHTFFQYVPPKKYFKTNPEYFSMFENGVRSWRPSGQLCMSNKEMRKVAYNSLVGFIKKDRAKYPKNYPTLYELSQEDNTYYMCACPDCKAITKKYGGENGLLLEFVNELANKIAKIYPDVYIRTFAYVSTEQPVKGISPAPNVIVQYCDLYGYSNHMYPLTDPINKDRYELYMKWVKKTPNLMVWDYILGKPGVSALDAIIADTRLFKKTGLKWIFVESEYIPYNPPAFRILQYFLEAQLLYDSSQDAEKLINIFMDNYFGAAAPEMKEYLALLRKIQKTCPTPATEWRYNRVTHTSNFPFLNKARTIINKGFAKVKNNKQVAGRVARELVGIHSYLFKFYRNNPQKAAEFKALLAEYKKMMTFSINGFPYREKHKKELFRKLADELSIVGMKFKDLPPELAKLPESKVIAVPYIYQQGYTNTRKVKDPDSCQKQSLSWIPGAGRKHGLPQMAGVYAQIKKKCVQIRITKAPKDEKYHWYKIGEVELDADSYFFVTDWHNSIRLKSFYTLADGYDFNPNKYEAWISIKMQGPAYVPGSKKENAFLIDRGFLVKKY